MRRARRLLQRVAGGLLLVLAATCGRHAEPWTGPLRFGWQAPLRFSVVDEAERGGVSTRLRWRLSFQAVAGERAWRLRFEEVEPLTLQGQELTDRKARGLVLAGLATSTALPDLLLDERGRILRVTGHEERAAAFLERLRSSGAELEEERLATLAEALAGDSLRRELAQRAAELWKVWVETWVGLDLPAGGSRQETLSFPLPDGRSLEVPLQIQNQGPVTEPEGALLLTTQVVVEGPEASDALARSLADAALRAGREAPGASEVALFRRQVRADVVTDPATLRPDRADTLSRVEVVLRDGRTSVQEERHRYRFRWP